MSIERHYQGIRNKLYYFIDKTNKLLVIKDYTVFLQSCAQICLQNICRIQEIQEI